MKVRKNFNWCFFKNRALILLKGSIGQLKFKIPLRVFEKATNSFIYPTKAPLQLLLSLFKIGFLGITIGFGLKMILKGVGFRGREFLGNPFFGNYNYRYPLLVLHLGYTGRLLFWFPLSLFIRCRRFRLSIIGCEKSLIKQTALRIRSLRLPDIYRGKGIQYVGEQFHFKIGKQR